MHHVLRTFCVLTALGGVLAAEPPSAAPPAETQAASTDSLRKALTALFKANRLELDFRDEGPQPTQRAKTQEFRFRPGRFWQDLSAIEKAFGVQIQWIGEGFQGRCIVRLPPKGPRTDAVLVQGRYRVIVLTPRADPPGGDEACREVTLNFLPGPRVLAARWQPPVSSLAKAVSAIPHMGTVYLGEIALAGKLPPEGTIEIVTAGKWARMPMDATKPSVVEVSPDSYVRAVRCSGVSTVTPEPAETAASRNDNPAPHLEATFWFKCDAGGIYLPRPSDIVIVDSKDRRHPAVEVRMSPAHPCKYQASFEPLGPGVTPRRFEIMTPTKVQTERLDLGRMEKLSP